MDTMMINAERKCSEIVETMICSREETGLENTFKIQIQDSDSTKILTQYMYACGKLIK